MNSFDVDRLRKEGPAEERLVRLIEGLCAEAIDVRSSMTCILSAEDGEWTLGEHLVRFAKDYKAIMRLAVHHAEAACSEPERLVWELMNQAAKDDNQPAILPW